MRWKRIRNKKSLFFEINSFDFTRFAANGNWEQIGQATEDGDCVVDCCKVHVMAKWRFRDSVLKCIRTSERSCTKESLTKLTGALTSYSYRKQYRIGHLGTSKRRRGSKHQRQTTAPPHVSLPTLLPSLDRAAHLDNYSQSKMARKYATKAR